MIPLRGTLETVVLRDIYRGNTALGTTKRDGQDIYVSKGGQPFRQGVREVLVRTDTGSRFDKNCRPKTGEDIPTLDYQTGNFVTSEIPPEVQKVLRLYPDKYFLTGDFDGDLTTGHLTREFINMFYDPGKMIVAYFSTEEPGIWVPSGEPLPIQGYEDALLGFMEVDPRLHSRVILTETESQLQALHDIIRQRGQVPVRMDNLKKI